MSRSTGISPALRFLKACKPNTLIKALSGAAVLWAFLPSSDTSAARIHEAFRSQVWKETGWPGRLVLAVGFLFWLPVALFLVASCTRQCGARVRRDHGVSIPRQVAGQLGLVMRYAIPPRWYYVFELHDAERRHRALEYLYRFETKSALYDLLRRYLSSAETSGALSDKAAFALRCRDHGVEAVAALGTVDACGVLRLDGWTDELPPRDLFFKPLRGAGGRGAARWLYRGEGWYVDRAGRPITQAELLRHLLALGAREPHVVRAFVRNHHEVAELSPGALSTVRILTCIDESGRPEVTHAVLRMARDDSVVVDNFHAGGLAAAVDIETGVLGQASDMGLRSDSRWHDVHPATGAQIFGRKLPRWNEVMMLACRAHTAFSDQCAIGWDVAILEDGVSLVEGNKGPDLDIIQRICREPVGNSRFGDLMVHHIERALSVKARRLAVSTSSVAPLTTGMRPSR
jgi:hypothetical protein